MQGILVILVLVSGVGVKFNTGQFVNCKYNTSSEGLKLPTTIGVSPLCLGINYLMSEETSPLHGDSNLEVSSDSGIAKKPTTVHYIVEGIGGVVGGILGFTIVGIPLIPYMWLPSDQINFVALYSLMGIGTTFGTVFGVTGAGEFMKQEGSFLKSLVGSTIGLVIGAILMEEDISYLFLGSSIGAVIGYNWK